MCKRVMRNIQERIFGFSQDYASTYSIDLIIIYESTLMLIIIHQRENLKI
jgi:hypothetical protein